MSAPETPVCASQDEACFLDSSLNGRSDSMYFRPHVSTSSDYDEFEDNQGTTNSNSTTRSENIFAETNIGQLETSFDDNLQSSLLSHSVSTLLSDNERDVSDVDSNSSTNNEYNNNNNNNENHKNNNNNENHDTNNDDDNNHFNNTSNNDNDRISDSFALNHDSELFSTTTHIQKLPDSPRSQSSLATKANESPKISIPINRPDLPISPSSQHSSQLSNGLNNIEFITDQSLNQKFNSTSTIEKIQHNESNSTIKTDSVSSDITEPVLPVVKPKNKMETKLDSQARSEKARNNHFGSLNSSCTELSELEHFIPDVHFTNSEGKFDSNFENYAGPLLGDNELMEKPVSHKSFFVASEKNEDPLQEIGVKKEQSVINSLKQENFKLKIKVVLLENHLNSISPDGVAELKKKLSESEANRIAMKSENDKLRQTISSLNNEEVSEEKERTRQLIQKLQDEISFYKNERVEFEQERFEWKHKEHEIKVSLVHHRKFYLLLILFRYFMRKNCITRRWKCLILSKKMRNFSTA